MIAGTSDTDGTQAANLKTALADPFAERRTVRTALSPCDTRPFKQD